MQERNNYLQPGSKTSAERRRFFIFIWQEKSLVTTDNFESRPLRT